MISKPPSRHWHKTLLAHGESHHFHPSQRSGCLIYSSIIVSTCLQEIICFIYHAPSSFSTPGFPWLKELKCFSIHPSLWGWRLWVRSCMASFFACRLPTMKQPQGDWSPSRGWHKGPGKPSDKRKLPQPMHCGKTFLRAYQPLVSLNKALLHPYFWQGCVGGGVD